MLVDNISDFIKRELPRQTSYFGSSIGKLNSITISPAGLVTVTTTEKHGLSTDNEIFLQGAILYVPIEKILGKTITTTKFHHLLSKYTDKVNIICPTDPLFNGELTLLEDIDSLSFTVDVDVADDYEVIDLTGCYFKLYKNNTILNDYHKVTVATDYVFTFQDLEEYYLNCLVDSTNAYITIGQRINGCLDLNNASDLYCNALGIDAKDIFDTEKNIVISRFKENEDLTCYIEVENNFALTQNSMYEYNLNLYVFFPIKNNNNEKYYLNNKINQIVHNVFNKLLCNRNIDLDFGLSIKTTSPLRFKNTTEAIKRNNVLYIQKISYSFMVPAYYEDFEPNEDYLRLNSIIGFVDDREFINRY